MLEFVYKTAGQITGGTDTLKGVDTNPSARKSATQAEDERQSGEVRIDFPAEWQNDTFLKWFVYVYSILSQSYLQQEVEDLMELWNEKSTKKGKPVDEKKKWDFIKSKSLAFQNFLSFSNIEEKIRLRLKELRDGGMPLTATVAEDFIDTQLLYEAIIERLRMTNIIVDGSTSEVSAREAKQDFLDYITSFLMTLPLAEAGMSLKIKEIIRVASKLFGMPEADFVQMISQAQASNPQSLMTQQAAALQASGVVPPEVATPQEQPIPEEGVEVEPTEIPPSKTSQMAEGQ